MGELKPCGTLPAYRRHLRGGERPCDACRVASAAYHRRLHSERKLGRVRLVPADGARRRLEALTAIGWTYRAIADELGWDGRMVHRVLRENQKISRRNLELVRELYERHWNDPRTLSKYNKWPARFELAPPLAWDDYQIDKPEGKPEPWQRSARQTRKSSDLLQDVDELRSEGYTLPQIAERLGITAEAITRAQRRFELKQQKAS